MKYLKHEVQFFKRAIILNNACLIFELSFLTTCMHRESLPQTQRDNSKHTEVQF